MSFLILPQAFALPMMPSMVTAALVAGAVLISPVTTARAEEAPTVPIVHPSPAPATPQPNPAAASALPNQVETVEARIVTLRTTLKITPEQEAKWGEVAQAMRENAANMYQLVAEKRGQNPAEVSALDDLLTYQKFAQAHVDGLKNLTEAFTALYEIMPGEQKKIADQVFQNFGHDPARFRGPPT